LKIIVTEILLKVALNTINLNLKFIHKVKDKKN